MSQNFINNFVVELFHVLLDPFWVEHKKQLHTDIIYAGKSQLHKFYMASYTNVSFPNSPFASSSFTGNNVQK